MNMGLGNLVYTSVSSGISMKYFCSLKNCLFLANCNQTFSYLNVQSFIWSNTGIGGALICYNI